MDNIDIAGSMHTATTRLTHTVVWLAAAMSASPRLCERASSDEEAIATVARLGDAVLSVAGHVGTRAAFAWGRAVSQMAKRCSPETSLGDLERHSRNGNDTPPPMCAKKDCFVCALAFAQPIVRGMCILASMCAYGRRLLRVIFDM